MDAPMDDTFYTEEPESPFPSQSSNSMQAMSPQMSQISSSSQRTQTGRRLFAPERLNSITDATRFPLCLDRFFHEHDLMVPKDKDLDSIEAHEKSWAMMRPGAPTVVDGISWSFVDVCGGLSSELLKVCHFFDVINAMSQHHPWTGFVVPTTDISNSKKPRNLKLKYSKNDVVGVIDSRFVETDRDIQLGSSDKRGVDSGKLLCASEMNSSGTQNTLLPLFKIQVGFTAAFFKSDPLNQDDADEVGEHRQATFGVVTVTSLRNVDSLKFIVVRPARNHTLYPIFLTY